MTIFTSVQLTNQLAIPPVYDDAVQYYGKFRVIRFNYLQVALGTIGDSVRLCRLPAGKVNVFGLLSTFGSSAGGGAMTLNMGSEAYRDKLGNVVAAALTSMYSALAVAAAQRSSPNLPAAPADGVIQYESMNGVIITATTAVVAPPANMTMAGYLLCTVE